jgi:dehydrogenase/reductase SDR family member 7
MNGVSIGLLSLIVVLIAIFFRGDCDLPLLFFSDPPPNAYLDQVIWITGASSGLGAELALEYTKLGAKVFLLAYLLHA